MYIRTQRALAVGVSENIRIKDIIEYNNDDELSKKTWKKYAYFDKKTGNCKYEKRRTHIKKKNF